MMCVYSIQAIAQGCQLCRLLAGAEAEEGKWPAHPRGRAEGSSVLKLQQPIILIHPLTLPTPLSLLTSFL